MFEHVTQADNVETLAATDDVAERCNWAAAITRCSLLCARIRLDARCVEPAFDSSNQEGAVPASKIEQRSAASYHREHGSPHARGNFFAYIGIMRGVILVLPIKLRQLRSGWQRIDDAGSALAASMVFESLTAPIAPIKRGARSKRSTTKDAISDRIHELDPQTK